MCSAAAAGLRRDPRQPTVGDCASRTREFFSRHDPLYRTYGKTEALDVQKRLFQSDPRIEASWNRYVDSVKAFANFAKSSGEPFDVSLGGKPAKGTRRWMG